MLTIGDSGNKVDSSESDPSDQVLGEFNQSSIQQLGVGEVTSSFDGKISVTLPPPYVYEVVCKDTEISPLVPDINQVGAF